MTSEKIEKYAFHVKSKDDFSDLLTNLNQHGYHLIKRLEEIEVSKLLNQFLTSVVSEAVDLIIFNYGLSDRACVLDWTTAKIFPKTRYSKQYKLVDYVKGNDLPEDMMEAI